MEQHLIWKVLGIEETKDEEVIRQAYREKLSGVNPEEDQAGFMRLREAYEQAVEFARTDDEGGDDWEALKNGSELDQWIYQINCIYEDVDKRKNPAKWKEAFKADVCMAFDMEAEVAERFLVYIMSHHYLPMEVWQTIDKQFHYSDDMEQLKEKFPEDFLKYVNYKINNEEFLDFDIFSGETSEHVDDYLYKYFDLKNLIDRTDGNNLDEIKAAVKVLDDYDTYHPYADVELMRYYFLTKEDANIEKAAKKADELYSEYPENPYISYYCGEAFEKYGQKAEAEEIWNKLLADDPDHYMAKYGVAKLMAEREQYADAKEYCLDLLDIDDRSVELREFLDELNVKLVEIYQAKLSENKDDFEVTNKLAWCYFQQQKFKEVETLLLQLDEKYHEEYDYINLIGRNYLAMDEYDKAMKYLPRWQEMIEETVDDGSKEATKRLNRRGFSYFAIGYCQWNQNLIPEATENLYKSFELEEKLPTKLSYMDQLALFYLDAGSLDQAIDMCNQIIALDYNYFPAYVKRQQAYFEQKNGQGIIDDFYECIRLYPPYVKPYVLAYKTFYFYRQYEDAAGIWKRAEEAGVKSDEMQLYRYKIRRLTETGQENWQKLLGEVIKFKDHYFAKKNDPENEEECDIEDEAELYMEIGLLYWNLDDLNAAMRTVEEGIHKCGKKNNLIWLKADLLMDQNKHADALHFYRKVVANEPDNANVHINIGKCLDKIGAGQATGEFNDKAKEALVEYEKAVELNPHHSEAHFLIMRLYKRQYLKTNDRKVKKEAFDKALYHANMQIENVDDAYYYIERGLIFEEEHMLKEALADFLKAGELEPDNIYAHNNAGNICKKMRNYELGLQEFQKALKLPNPDHNVWVHASMADLYEAMGEHQKAVEYTEKELEHAPRNIYLLEDLARRYMNLYNFDKAGEVYDKLLSLNPNNYQLMLKKAKFYYYNQQHREAEKQFLSVIKRVDGNGEAQKQAYNKLALFYLDTDQYKKAVETYQKCLNLAGEFDTNYKAIRYFDIAQTYFEMGNRQDAAVYAKKYLDLLYHMHGSLEAYLDGEPASIPNHIFLIVFSLVMIGDIALAEQYQKRMDSCYLCSWCNRGVCYEKFYGLGLIEEAKGNLQKAFEYFTQSMNSLPSYENEDVRRSYRRVQRKLQAANPAPVNPGASNPVPVNTVPATGVEQKAVQPAKQPEKKGLFGFFKKK